MAITSTSTHAQVIAQYNDNLVWEGSITKAQLALEAIRWLLVNRPQMNSINGRSTNYSQLEDEKNKLQEFVGQFATGVNKVSFTRGVMNL